MRGLSILLSGAMALFGTIDLFACGHGERGGGGYTPGDSVSRGSGSSSTGTPTSGTPTAGTPATGSGKVAGGARGRRGGARGAQVEEWFAPGSDGSLAWNTTQKVKNRPILVYFYDGHVNKGMFYRWAQWTEQNIFRQKKIIEKTRDFYCEKICLRTDGLAHYTKGRPFLKDFLGKYEAMEPRKPMVALLDSHGKVIKTYDNKIKSYKTFLKELAKAEKENKKRLAAAVKAKGKKVKKAKSALDILKKRVL